MTLPGHRNVVYQNALTALTMIFSGTEPRKLLKVMDQMRRIEIPARRCNVNPIWRGGFSDKFERPLKPLHAAKQLRPHADLIRERLAETPLTEPDMLSDLANRCIPTKGIDRCPHCTMSLQCADQTRCEGFLQEPEPFGGSQHQDEYHQRHWK
jgi:hypothetical protein